MERVAILVKWHGRTPPALGVLAAPLRSWGVALLPIGHDRLAAHRFGGHRHVLSLTTDPEGQEAKLRLLSGALGFAIRRGRLTLLDVTSFPDPGTRLADDGGRHRIIPLPMDADGLARLVAEEALSKEEDAGRWPGGRRARIPPLPRQGRRRP